MCPMCKGTPLVGECLFCDEPPEKDCIYCNTDLSESSAKAKLLGVCDSCLRKGVYKEIKSLDL